jgi:hypothetical protein
MLPALSQLPERIDGTSIRFERSEQNDPCPSPKKKTKKEKRRPGARLFNSTGSTKLGTSFLICDYMTYWLINN